ncbi:hypothetical protein [[Phormidium] sp. ETS-05]|uniref:hypothetical protein n=1 Tax=[Phormidium] sp. ETS-05 TaxID=222819 RepID=UPI0018EEF811|nr:hypothetical protein [[Phormidium] sp. ETS-05]
MTGLLVSWSEVGANGHSPLHRLVPPSPSPLVPPSPRPPVSWGLGKILCYCTTIMVFCNKGGGYCQDVMTRLVMLWGSHEKDCQMLQIIQQVVAIAPPFGMRLPCTPEYLHHNLRKNGEKFYQFC